MPASAYCLAWAACSADGPAGASSFGAAPPESFSYFLRRSSPEDSSAPSIS